MKNAQYWKMMRQGGKVGNARRASGQLALRAAKRLLPLKTERP